MALKTFNIDEQVYKKYSSWCKKNGISMSRRIENFLRNENAGLQNTDKKIESPKKVNISEVAHRPATNSIPVDKTEKKEHPLGKYC